MQNAGQQYGQGGASAHQTAPFSGQSDTTTSGGSITSSLRQFRRKNEDKHSHTDTNTTSTPAESHVARVAPHSHYPPRTTAECYRYPHQYTDYGLQQPVKYSEISEPHPQLQEHISPSVIQKAKSKEYMEMCNVQQQHMKPTYDHLNGQQTYQDANVLPHTQYIHKDPQVHHGYKPESQYYPKEPQFSPQLPHQIPKYPQMSPQVRKYPPENDFLQKLRRIHPTMARSIMSDHHLQESQTSYQTMDQNRMYAPSQNQRYLNYPSGMQNGGYTHGYVPYSNYPASCSYNRPPQMTPRFPPVNPHERSLSPRRGYPDNMGIPMNYGGIPPQKISPNYPQYNAPEYAQHYQHRRGAPMAQEYYSQHCRPTQYLPHQMPSQEIAEGRVAVSENIKHYIETWADEETATEMTQIENSRLCKDPMRGRDDQSTETVYMINASELQYLENELPLVTNENGVTVPVEAGQYIIKSGVSIMNGSEMVRIVEKSQVEIDHNGERVVNLHIMDTTKPDCMMANKPNELNQRQPSENPYPLPEKPRVMVHQNTVITNAKESEVVDESVKVGTSLPIITDTLEELNRTIVKECRKETADKNCSPINLDQYREHEESEDKSENSLVEEIASIQELHDSPKNLPFADAHLDTKTDNKEHAPLLEDVDPHEHIDTLLQDTIHGAEAIETETAVDHEETSKTQSSNISVEESLKVEETVTSKTEESPPITEDNKNNQKSIEGDEEMEAIESQNDVDSKNETLSPTEEDSKEVTDKMEDSNEKSVIIETKLTTTKVKDNIFSESLPEFAKSTTKRSRRIFSVDDIINNIGKNLKRSNNDHWSRRHSIQTTKDFLDVEIKNTFKTRKCSPPPPEKLVQDDEDSEKQESVEYTKVPTVLETKEEVQSEEVTEKTESAIEEIDDGTELSHKNEDQTLGKVKIVQVEVIGTEEEMSNSEMALQSVAPEEVVLETKQTLAEDETVEKQPKIPDEDDSGDSKVPDQEVQYRNVIRVEESSVILEIAGELVEINVNNVNGKNIITVVPLSDTSVVDCNDNYETLEETDPLKLDEAQDHENLDYIQEAQEPEVVETTSEIIIGMDLSLEEEIKLDLDQPPVLCTKAAKKAYDCDLQIPSITTSDDVFDNTRSESYTANDKVSSTKEKIKSDKVKKKSKPDSSKTEDPPKRLTAKSDKKAVFRDLIAARNKKKLREASKAEEDDFVPFKELVRARKLKKLKLLKMKSNDDHTVDSTIKIDESNKDAERLIEESTEKDQTGQKNPEYDAKVEDKTFKAKRVSFSDISREIEEKPTVPEPKIPKLEDPRLNRPVDVAKTKKKLSLEEYNKRKRKLQDAPKIEKNEIKKLKLDRHNSVLEFGNHPGKIKPQRTKSLDDINSLKPKDAPTKRKLSVEYSPVKQNHFDWEETQSPKMNLTSKDQENKFSEFRGLITEGKIKPKMVIDINDLNSKPAENSEDEILQNYKDQVESKMSTLNILIPRSKPLVDPFLKPGTNTLIDRFLKNEKLTTEEMEKIRKIISYKRLVQQFKKIKSPDLSQSPLDPSYEVRKEVGDKDTRLLLKKVQDKKKARFRNLYSRSDTESEDDFREKSKCGDYSVVQSNCLAGVVPKLIIKRKTEMPLPVVRLERLDLGLLDDKNRCNV